MTYHMGTPRSSCWMPFMPVPDCMVNQGALRWHHTARDLAGTVSYTYTLVSGPPQVTSAQLPVPHCQA